MAKKTIKPKPAQILQCMCSNEYQDGRYGKNKRVHSFGPKCHNGREGYRCTVCAATTSE